MERRQKSEHDGQEISVLLEGFPPASTAGAGEGGMGGRALFEPTASVRSEAEKNQEKTEM